MRVIEITSTDLFVDNLDGNGPKPVPHGLFDPRSRMPGAQARILFPRPLFGTRGAARISHLPVPRDLSPTHDQRRIAALLHIVKLNNTLKAALQHKTTNHTTLQHLEKHVAIFLFTHFLHSS